MHLSGVEELQQALRDSIADVRLHTENAIAASVSALERRIIFAAPRRSGVLKGDVFSQVRGLSGGVGFGADAFYWHFVEYGTVKMAAQPFVRPSAELEFDTFLKRMRDIVPKLQRNFSQARAA